MKTERASKGHKVTEGDTHPPPGLARLDGESEPAWRAFCIFMTRASRDMLRTSRDIGHRSHSMVHRWSQKHRWRERATAHDMERLREALDQRHETDRIILAGEREVIEAALEMVRSASTPPAQRLGAMYLISKAAGERWSRLQPLIEASAGVVDAGATEGIDGAASLVRRACRVLSAEELDVLEGLLSRVEDGDDAR